MAELVAVQDAQLEEACTKAEDDRRKIQTLEEEVSAVTGEMISWRKMFEEFQPEGQDSGKVKMINLELGRIRIAHDPVLRTMTTLMR